MEFLRRVPGHQSAGRVALMPGSFNPPTNAHRALLESVIARVDEAVVVLPRSFPHKKYHGASLDDRVRMLESLSPVPYSIAISEGGLFLEMAGEFRAVNPSVAEIFIACGRDAAERILGWTYPDPGMLDRMFEAVQLLVASRQGAFEVPPRFRERIHLLDLDPVHDKVSSSEIRSRIQSRDEWRHLVPELIVPVVESIYG